MMHGIEDPKLRLARRVQNFQHMRDAVVGFGNSFDARPDLAAFGNEVIVGIDHQKCGDAFVVCRDVHGVPPADCRDWVTLIPALTSALMRNVIQRLQFAA
jgi:hypothetical protein